MALSNLEEYEAALAVLKDRASAKAAVYALQSGIEADLLDDAAVALYVQAVRKEFDFGGNAPGTFDQCVLHMQEKKGHGEESARRICGAIMAAQETAKTEHGDREALREAAEARSRKYGIPVLEGGHLTPPKGFPADEDNYGDPTNYAYPLHDKIHAKNAHARFVQFHDQYPQAAQKVVFTRIVEAEMARGVEPHPDADMMALLPQTLQDKLSTKNAQERTDKSLPASGDAPTTPCARCADTAQRDATIEKSASFYVTVPFRKRVDAATKRELHTVIYYADREDGHGEYAKAETLRKAAHDWLAHSREVSVEHTSEVAKGVVPVESYIARADDPEIHAHVNDWCGVFKVTDGASWDRVESGEWSGVSIEGMCSKVHEGARKQLVNMLVTKVSMVRDPATRLAFVAKSQSPRGEEMKLMKDIKTKLDKLQDIAVEFARTLDLKLPLSVPTFVATKSEEEHLALITSRQADFVAEIFQSALPLVKKSQEDLEALAGIVKELHATQATYDKMLPDLAKLLAGDAAEAPEPAAA